MDVRAAVRCYEVTLLEIHEGQFLIFPRLVLQLVESMSLTASAACCRTRTCLCPT